MSFSSWSAFFAMGGYARFVWPAYGITFVVLAAVMLAPVLRHRKLQRALARREQRAARTAENNNP